MVLATILRHRNGTCGAKRGPAARRTPFHLNRILCCPVTGTTDKNAVEAAAFDEIIKIVAHHLRPTSGLLLQKALSDIIGVSKFAVFIAFLLSTLGRTREIAVGARTDTYRRAQCLSARHFSIVVKAAGLHGEAERLMRAKSLLKSKYNSEMGLAS